MRTTTTDRPPREAKNKGPAAATASPSTIHHHSSERNDGTPETDATQDDELPLAPAGNLLYNGKRARLRASLRGLLCAGGFGRDEVREIFDEVLAEHQTWRRSLPETFVERWLAGDLPLMQFVGDERPVAAGAFHDLYTLFRAWARAQGDRWGATEKRFAMVLLAAGLRQTRIRLRERKEYRQTRVYWVDQRIPDGEEDVTRWIALECSRARICAQRVLQ